MGSALPAISESWFRERLQGLSPSPCPDTTLRALFEHYGELRRWNHRLSLVGPGTAGEILERHYGESLVALRLLRRRDRSLLDVGTGGGFPGLVLAAARPGLDVTLLEPRQRKWAFLQAAVRRGGLSCRCLDARVELPLPPVIPGDLDVVTCRALKLSPRQLEALYQRSPRVRFLLWCGAEPPDLPAGWRRRRELPLAGSAHRRILEIDPARA